MRNTIKRYNIDCFWHFTDRSNLGSIEEHGGLWSFAKLRERGIAIPILGSSEGSRIVDARMGLDKYVHASFCADSPMLWQIEKHNKDFISCWLKIDIALIYGNGVRFCAGVANKSGSEILTAAEAETKIDFEGLFEKKGAENFDRRKEANKSEILIPDCIPLQYITFT